MAIETVFLAVAAILFIGFIGERIFEKTKIPDVIWLLLLGIIMGSILRWVSSNTFQDIAPFFTTFALIFLLFEAGLNTDLKKFLISAPQGMKLSISSFLLSFAVIFLIGMLIRIGIIPSLLLGVILAGLSSAVVIPIINNLKMEPLTKLTLVFDSAFSDVLCILGTVTIVEVVQAASIDGMSIAHSILSSFLIAIMIGTVAALIWKRMITGIVNSHHFILTLAAMLIIYSLTGMLKANGAIACLIFGLILGNSKKIAEVFQKKEKNLITRSGKEFYSEVAFFIKTFFFVYLGIIMDFSEPWSFLWGLLILAGIYAARPFAVWFSFGKGVSIDDVRVLETLIPKGLAAAVLVQIPIQAGIPGTADLANITLAVILLSIISSTVFVYLIQKKRFPGLFGFLHRKYA